MEFSQRWKKLRLLMLLYGQIGGSEARQQLMLREELLWVKVLGGAKDGSLFGCCKLLLQRRSTHPTGICSSITGTTGTARPLSSSISDLVASQAERKLLVIPQKVGMRKGALRRTFRFDLAEAVNVHCSGERAGRMEDKSG